MKKNTLTLIITAILIITCSFLAIFFSEEKTIAYSDSDPSFYYWLDSDSADVYLYTGNIVYGDKIKIHVNNYSSTIPLSLVSGQQGVYMVDYGYRANAKRLFADQNNDFLCEFSGNYRNVNILNSSLLFNNLSLSDENDGYFIDLFSVKNDVSFCDLSKTELVINGTSCNISIDNDDPKIEISKDDLILGSNSITVYFYDKDDNKLCEYNNSVTRYPVVSDYKVTNSLGEEVTSLYNGEDYYFSFKIEDTTNVDSVTALLIDEFTQNKYSLTIQGPDSKNTYTSGSRSFMNIPVGHRFQLVVTVVYENNYQLDYSDFYTPFLAAYNEVSLNMESSNTIGGPYVAKTGDKYTITVSSDVEITEITSSIENVIDTYGVSSTEGWTSKAASNGSYIYSYSGEFTKNAPTDDTTLRYINVESLSVTVGTDTDFYDFYSFDNPIVFYPEMDLSYNIYYYPNVNYNVDEHSSFIVSIYYNNKNTADITPDLSISSFPDLTSNASLKSKVSKDNGAYNVLIYVSDIESLFKHGDNINFDMTMTDNAGNEKTVSVVSDYKYNGPLKVTPVGVTSSTKETYSYEDEDGNTWYFINSNDDNTLYIDFTCNQDPAKCKVKLGDYNVYPYNFTLVDGTNTQYRIEIDDIEKYNLPSGQTFPTILYVSTQADQENYREYSFTDENIIYMDNLDLDWNYADFSSMKYLDSEDSLVFTFTSNEDVNTTNRDIKLESLDLYYINPVSGEGGHFSCMPEGEQVFADSISTTISMSDLAKELEAYPDLDNLRLYLSASISDRSGNIYDGMDSYPLELNSFYYRDISKSVSSVYFTNSGDELYTKEGDTLKIGFKSSHPLAKFNSNGIYVLDGKINGQAVAFTSDSGRMEWIAEYQIPEDCGWTDNTKIQVSVELFDESDNKHFVIDNIQEESLIPNDIFFYAPISISNLSFVSNNEGTDGLYANDNNTVTLSFDTTHYVGSVLNLADKKPYLTSEFDESCYHYTVTLDVADLNIEDNTNIPFDFTLMDDADNEPLHIFEQDTNAHVIYQAPIKVDDLSVKSNNVSSDVLAKDGDNINISFTTKHPVNIVSAKAAGVDITLSSENNDGMHWSGTVTVPNGIVADNAFINVRIELGDVSGNDNYVIENSDIQYYAPISISSTTIVTDNANDKTKYAIDGNTVTVSFITNHKIDLGSSSFSLAGRSGLTASESALEGGMYKYVFARKVAAGELVDLSTVAFSISVTDIAKNNAVTANEKSSGVINSITYYAPLDIKTTIASSGVNTGYAKNGDTVTISAAANHNASVSSATLSDRTMAASGNDTTALKITYTIDAGEKNLKEGKLATALNFTDVAGNTFTADAVNEGSVIYDRTSPSINVKDAFSGFSANDISFNINISDENIDREKTKIDVNGSILKIGSGIIEDGTTYSAVIQNEEDGTYTIVISATDLAGNVADSVKYTVTVDKTNPTITVTTFYSSSNKIYKPGLVIADLFDLDEDNMAEISCTISDGSSVTDWDINEPLVTDGKKTISVIAVDKAGNASEQLIFDVFIDGTAPNPILKDNISNKTLEVGLNEFDEKASIVFTLQALSYSSEPDKFTKLIVTLPDGTTVDLIESNHVDSNGDYYYDFDSAGDYKVTLAAVDDLGNSTGDITYEIKVNEKPLDAIKRVLDISGDEKASIAGVTFSVKTIAIIVGSALGGTALIIAVLLIIRKKRHR